MKNDSVVSAFFFVILSTSILGFFVILSRFRKIEEKYENKRKKNRICAGILLHQCIYFLRGLASEFWLKQLIWLTKLTPFFKILLWLRILKIQHFIELEILCSKMSQISKDKRQITKSRRCKSNFINVLMV